MQFSPLLLTGLAVLIYLGLLQRVLDRMRLSDRAALLFVGLMLVGTYLPDIPLGLMRVNLGGAIVPLALAAYLVATADELKEQVRALIGAAVVVAAVFLLDWVLPQEPGAMFLDPLYAYGLAAGLVGYIAGRSRRGSFVAATMGVLIADAIVAFSQLPTGMVQYLGGGGAFDATLIAGVVAVGTAEIIGETREYAGQRNQPKNKIAWLEDKRRQRQKKGR